MSETVILPQARDLIWTINVLHSSRGHGHHHLAESVLDLMLDDSDEARQVRREVLLECYPYVQPRSEDERQFVRESYVAGKCRCGRPDYAQ